jgi:hypothetical protein
MVAQRLQSLMVLGLLLVGVLAGACVATALEVGDRVPDFTLPSTTERRSA